VHYKPRGGRAINAPQSEGFVGHEWEVQWCLRCGSIPCIVNVADHLWWVSLGTSMRSTRVVSLDTPGPLSGFATSDPGLGATGFARGGCLQCRRYPSLLADQWAPMIKGCFQCALWPVGPRDRGSCPRHRPWEKRGQIDPYFYGSWHIIFLYIFIILNLCITYFTLLAFLILTHTCQIVMNLVRYFLLSSSSSGT
jgi:hypothetical protein